MRVVNSLLVVCALFCLSQQSLLAQRIREFPPQLPPRFTDVPLSGGRVNSITVKPNDSSHMIVSTEIGGLWKTEDGGASWFHLDNLMAVFTADVSYAGEHTVIAALNRDNRRENGGGIWLSRDGGGLWSKPRTADPPSSPRTPERGDAYGISAAPDNPNKIYVGTDYGIAVSDDNGGTWAHHMLENTSPIDDDRLQNAVLSVLALPGNQALALCRTGVYRTNNGGSVWTLIRPGYFDSGVKNIDASPFDSDKVFILQDYFNLWLYEMSSNRWTRIAVPGGGSRGPFVRVSKSVAGPGAIDIWVGAGVYLLKITRPNIDSVRTIASSEWTLLRRDEGIHDDSGYLALDNNKLPLLYGSDGGLFRPLNPEATRWTRAATGADGMNSYQITSLAGTNVGTPREGFRTSLYFATQDNAIWASSNAGLTWPFSDCAEGFHIQVRHEALTDSEVTVAYGKIGCEPSDKMFSDAHLANQRAVPDTGVSGETISHMSYVFLLSPNNWIRYRIAPDNRPEIFISQNNGNNWRKRANIGLEVRGVFAVSGNPANPTVYAPFRAGSDVPGRGERIGLVKLTNIYDSEIRDYDNSNLITLPDNGSLGVRATMFDWHAVYGVDPRNPNYIIAPDIYNQVVKVSRDGGQTWSTDVSLTERVTDGNSQLLYDEHPYRMQVTKISFDPYDPQHILIGTRQAGIIISDDGGNTWHTILDSSPILYITGFFFKPNGMIYVSTYGRGLWVMDLRIMEIPFPLDRLCRGIACIVRFPADPRKLWPDLVSWQGKDVIAFYGGRINGLVISRGQLKTITVTPGTTYRRYLGALKDYPGLNIVESEKGIGFKGIPGALAALNNCQVIKGLILEDKRVTGLITGQNEFYKKDLQATETSVQTHVPLKSPASRQEPSEQDQPYLFITTSLTLPGIPVVGPDGIVHILATGFNLDPDSLSELRLFIDGKPATQNFKTAQPQGQLIIDYQVPDELALGEHSIELVQKVGDRELRAKSKFVKAAIDNFEKQ
jgi:hypothetical protein